MLRGVRFLTLPCDEAGAKQGRSSGEIELTAEEDNVLWTINQNNIQINGQTLKYADNSVVLTTGGGGSNFTVNKIFRIFYCIYSLLFFLA